MFAFLTNLGPIARILVGSLISFAIQALTAPPPPRVKAEQEINAPRSDRGKPLWWVGGTAWVAPELGWGGHFKGDAIKEGGGLFRKPTTTGFKYYYGWLGLLSVAPVDGISEIRFDKKRVWRGFRGTSSQISYSAKKIFGQAGGMSGRIDFMDGADDQAVNDYLAARLQSTYEHPAYRGLVSVVHRQNEIGNVAQLRPELVKVPSIYSTGWLPEFAPACVSVEDGANLYIAVDNSASMYAGDPTPMSVQKDGLKQLIARLRGTSANIRMVAFSDDVDTSIDQSGPDDAAFDALDAWVDGLTSGGSGQLEVAPPLSDGNKLTRGDEWQDVGTSAVLGELPIEVGGTMTVASYDALLTTGPIGDKAFRNDNNAEVSVLTGFDASETQNGDTITVSGSCIGYRLDNRPFPDTTTGASTAIAIRLVGYTQAQWDAGGFAGTTFGSRSVTLAGAFTSTETAYSFDEDFTVDSDNYAYIVVEIDLGAKFYASQSGGNPGQVHSYRLLNELSIIAPGEATNYEAGVSLASAFFDDPGAVVEDEGGSGSAIIALTEQEDAQTNAIPNVMVFLSDGVPSPVTTATAAQTITDALPSNVQRYAYNIIGTDTTYTELLDNTPRDSVPVLTSGEGIGASILGSFASWADLNAAHIVRHLATHVNVGGEFLTSDIGDSFAVAAETMFNEGMGLGGRFPAFDFDQVRREIEAHIGGVIEFDPTTGKWEFYLIRDDYDAGTIPVLSDIKDWGEVGRPLQAELPSAVTIIYTDRETGEAQSISRVNDAAAGVVGLKYVEREYLYFTCAEIASRVADRDLKTLTTPLWQITGAKVPYLDPALKRGRPFVPSGTGLGIDGVVMRIERIEEYEDGWVIDAREDVFGLPDDAFSIVPGAIAPNDTMLAPNVRWVEELPHFFGVQSFGAGTILSLLTDDTSTAYVAATCDRPNELHNGLIIADQTDTGWQTIEDGQYSPSAQLVSGVNQSPDTTTITVLNSDDLSELTNRDFVQINSEIMRIDSAVISGANLEITVGRGCLDTVPAIHTAGDWAIFFSVGAQIIDRQYTSADVDEDIKLLTRTARGILSPDDAATDNVTFANRMARPKPAGRVQGDGAYIANIVFDGSVDFTWAETNRRTDILYPVADFADLTTTPEAGTTYTVRLTWYDALEGVLGTTDRATGLTGTSYTLTDVATGQPAGATSFDVQIVSVRDGFEAWQSFALRYFLADYRATEAGNDRLTEDGDLRVTE